MAKNSNVTYTTLTITSGPTKVALDAVNKAQANFETVALAAAVKAGLVPQGMHGKIVRNRFGGGWQLAISPDPWNVRETASAAAI